MRRLFVFGMLAVMAAGCHRQTGAKPPSTPDNPTQGHAASAPPTFAVDAVATREGTASWYDVPGQSLPQRKAWTEEMTAASDTLPQNSYARVRRLDGQGTAVVVRITDSGVHRKGVLVDVSRPAAEALGIVKAGTASVRVETLALKNADADKPVEKKNEPAAAPVAKLNATPAADQKAEKNAANAKTGGQSAP